MSQQLTLILLLTGFCAIPAPTGGLDPEPRERLVSPSPPCAVGELPNEEGRCLTAEEAVVGAGGRVFWVDQRHPNASDSNPGTRDLPWLTIGRATGAGVLLPGDAVLVREGVYRESVEPRSGGTGPGKRITYAAYPGDQVVITGANVLPADAWHGDGVTWTQRWRRDLRAYGDDPVMRRELVVVDGEVLTPVAARESLEAGSFWAEGPDHDVRALHVRLSDGRTPHTAVVEAAERTRLFYPRPPRGSRPDCGATEQPGWIRLIGFTFRHVANRAQWGAVCAGGAHGLVEDVTVEWTNGVGFDSSGYAHVFRRNRALNNGQMGFSGSCNGCRFERNEAAFNNWKGYDVFWEAGGGKWTRSSGSAWIEHYAHNNHGPGLWLDIDNHDNEIIDGYFAQNAGAGILLELNTTGTRVEGNTVVGTRWLRWTGSGILSQAASHNLITRNTVTGNEGMGIWLRLDPNRRAEDGHNVITDNYVVGNAARSDVEAREISVEGTSIEHVRTNRFSGNRFGHMPARTMRSTFFVRPEPDNPAHYRGSDLSRWQELTGAVGDLVVVD